MSSDKDDQLDLLIADLLELINERAADDFLPGVVEADVRPLAEDLTSRGWTKGAPPH